MKSLSRVQLFATPWTVASQAPLSMGFSRQRYWNGLPFPLLGNLPDPGIEPKSPALAGGFFDTGGSVVKNLPTNAGNVGWSPGSGRSLEEGNGNPLQYSCLRNPMDRGV